MLRSQFFLRSYRVASAAPAAANYSRWGRRTYCTTAPPPKPTIEMIQELRFRTDAPITDCRKALIETNCDFEAAIAWLRKQGAAKAVKKQGRVTDHGVVASCLSATGSGGVIMTVCTETDFAARNEKFHGFAEATRQKTLLLLDDASKPHGLLETGIAEAEHAARRASFLERIRTAAEEDRKQLVAALGENIVVKSVVPPPLLSLAMLDSLPAETNGLPLKDFVFGSYVHNSFSGFRNIGLIAAVVVLQPRTVAPPVAGFNADDVAQHCVANYSNTAQAVAHQSFLGGDETCGQHLKKFNLALRHAVVVKVGEDPVYHTPAIRPPQQDKGKQQ